MEILKFQKIFFFPWFQGGATARIEESEGASGFAMCTRRGVNSMRATLSPEIDRQIRDDCFNLDHLLDIANSFNQDNAYGALELYQRKDDGYRTTGCEKSDDGLGKDEFAARRTFFQKRDSNDESPDEQPFRTLSRKQAIVTEKIRSNGVETHVIQEASVSGTRANVYPPTFSFGDSVVTTTTVASQQSVTSVTSGGGGVGGDGEMSSDASGAARFRSKSFLFLKPQIQ